MIARNYRKHPDAAALQLPLPFPHRLVWALPRPGARILRAIRAERARAFEAAGRIAYPVKASVPAWWRDAKKAARSLAASVQAACLSLWAEVRVAVTTADTALIGFNYERELADARAHGNRYRERVLLQQQQKHSRHFPQGCPRCDHQWVRIEHRWDDGNPEQWLQCTECGCSWHADHYDQAKRDLSDPDF